MDILEALTFEDGCKMMADIIGQFEPKYNCGDIPLLDVYFTDRLTTEKYQHQFPPKDGGIYGSFEIGKVREYRFDNGNIGRFCVLCLDTDGYYVFIHKEVFHG